MSKIETLVLSQEEMLQANEEEKRLPKYYILNSLGQYVFLRTRDRAKAQAFIDDEYGKGKYVVRVHGNGDKLKGEATCHGVETRRGQAKGRNESFGIPRGIR